MYVLKQQTAWNAKRIIVALRLTNTANECPRLDYVLCHSSSDDGISYTGSIAFMFPLSVCVCVYVCAFACSFACVCNFFKNVLEVQRNSYYERTHYVTIIFTHGAYAGGRTRARVLMCMCRTLFLSFLSHFFHCDAVCACTHAYNVCKCALTRCSFARSLACPLIRVLRQSSSTRV